MFWIFLLVAGVTLYALYLLKKSTGNGSKVAPAVEEEPVKKKIVLYYRNGCPPCEKIKPTWKTLEEAFKASEVVQVIKIDTEDPTSIIEDNIDGTPDIYLKYGTKVVQYSGDRSLDSLINFVLTN